MATRIKQSYLLMTLVFWVVQVTRLTAKQCTQVDSCSCTFDDGSKVDLNSLGNKDNTPRFQDVKGSQDGNVYSYNPCHPFTEASCDEAAACVQDPTLSQSVQIGDAAKAAIQFDDKSGNVVIGYTSGTIADLRVTEAIFVCEKSADQPKFTVQGEQKGGDFQFTIKTVCACPNGCSSSGPVYNESSGLSGGSIILIAFFCSIFIYFVAGVIFQKFVMKKEGKDVLPNSSLWLNIPVYIKAGVMFVLGRCIPGFRQYNLTKM